MKRPGTTFRVVVGWLWRHAAVGVVLLLIVAALGVGYRLGRPAPEPEAAEMQSADHEHAEPQFYTCSMHPSVRLPDPDAKCPICFMDLIPVADDAGAGGERRVAMSEAAAVVSRIETSPVARFFPRAEARLYGKVTYDETSVARITAYFPGRIDRLFVNFLGVPVAEGDHLAEVYSPTLLAAFEELRQAAGAADGSPGVGGVVGAAARDTLTAAREKLRLYGLTDAQVAAAERAGEPADRLTVFSPIGGVVTHLAVREGDYIDEGSPIATVADLSRLWLDLEAYESQLPLLRWGQRVTFTVEAQPGEVFGGRIAFIEPVIDDQTRTAAVRVAVDNAGRRLKPGMFASAVVHARLAEGGAVVTDGLAGRWVSPMHPTVVKDGPGACDVCGMDLVPAESLGVVGNPGRSREPLVIPRSAVLFTGTRSVVYVAVPDAEKPTYEAREVLLGPRAGAFYLVREGLAEDEQVVVNGAFRIDSAMQIAAKPSMMTPRGGGDVGDHAGHVSAEGGKPARAAVPDAFVFALKPVYAAYLDAQEALAADDLGGFSGASGDLSRAVGFVEEAGLIGETLAAWRRAAARLRAEGEPVGLAEARSRFASMSEAVIALQERFGHRGRETWNTAYCPMAFDNAGAKWLQRGETISNPYFGASMLRCGELRAAFPPLGAGPNGPPETPTHGEHHHE